MYCGSTDQEELSWLQAVSSPAALTSGRRNAGEHFRDAAEASPCSACDYQRTTAHHLGRGAQPIGSTADQLNQQELARLQAGNPSMPPPAPAAAPSRSPSGTTPGGPPYPGYPGPKSSGHGGSRDVGTPIYAESEVTTQKGAPGLGRPSQGDATSDRSGLHRGPPLRNPRPDRKCRRLRRCRQCEPCWPRGSVSRRER